MSFGFGDLLKFYEEPFGRGWANFLAIIIGLGAVCLVLTAVANFLGTVSTWLDGIGIEPSLWDKIYYVGKYATGMLLLLLISTNLISSSTQKRLEGRVRQIYVEAEGLLDDMDARAKVIESQLIRAEKVTSEAGVSIDEAKQAFDDAMQVKAHHEAAFAALPKAT